MENNWNNGFIQLISMFILIMGCYIQCNSKIAVCLISNDLLFKLKRLVIQN